jgi:hypothetical protein
VIDFFNNDCKTEVSEKYFGICDNPPPSTSQAYISTNLLEKDEKWLAVVLNHKDKTVEHFAIDNCIAKNTFLKFGGSQDESCDTMLRYDGSKIVFIELKNRKSNGWVAKAMNQLQVTLNNFKILYPTYKIKDIEAQICNKQRPFLEQSTIQQSREFFKKNNIILKIDPQVVIT